MDDLTAILKRHVWCIIFCSSVLLLAVCTIFFVAKDNEIVGYVSFAGAVTSIVLAIVVIIYTFNQTERSARWAERSEGNISEMKHLLDLTTQAQTEKFTAISQDMNALSKHLMQSPPKEVAAEEPTGKKMYNFKPECTTYIGILVFYYLVRASELHLDFHSNMIGEMVASKPEFSKYWNFYVDGILAGINSFLDDKQYISFDSERNYYRTPTLSQEFIGAVPKLLERAISHKDTPEVYKVLLTQRKERIDKHFTERMPLSKQE